MDAIDDSEKSKRKGKGKKKKKGRKSKALLLSSPTATVPLSRVSPSPSPAFTSGSKKRGRPKSSNSKNKKPRPSLDEEDDQQAPVNDIEEAVGVETEEALEAVAGDEMDATDASPEPENSKRKGKGKKKEKRKSKALLLSSPTATVSLSKESTSGSKKRARSKVSKDKKSRRSLAFEETIDDDFTHHRLVVNPGEDLVEVMEKFNRQYKRRNVCIISVGGFASMVAFEGFSYDTSALPDEEQMQLLSLSVGRIFKGDDGDSQNTEEIKLNASLLNVKVIGGTLVGPLIAARASPIHIVVGTSKRTTGESSTANQNINLASEDVGIVQEDAGVVAGTDDQTIQQPEIDPNNDEEDDQQAFVKPIKEALEEVTEEDAETVPGDEMDATDDSHSPKPENSKRKGKGKKKGKRKSKELLLSSPTATVPLSKVSTSPTSTSGSKKRGRPKVSKDKKPRSSLAFKETIDDDFTHHRLVVNPGEDLVKVMDKFIRQYKRRNVCIISVNGSASKVDFEQNGLYPLRYQEQMQLLSLSVGRIFKGDGDSQNTEEIKLNALLSRFTKPRTIFGGTLVGPLIAASPIQIIVGTFKRMGVKNKIIFPGESSTANQYLNLASEDDGTEQQILYSAMLLRLLLEAQMPPR